MKSLNPTGMIQASLVFASADDSVQRMVKSMDSISSIQKAISSINSNDSLQKMMEYVHNTKAIQTAMASVKVDDSVQRMMKSIDFTSSIQKAISSISSNDSLQKMMESKDFISSIQKVISSLNYTDSIQKIMESDNYAKTLNNISKFHNISSQLQSIGDFLAKPSILEQIIESNNSFQNLATDYHSIKQEQFTQSIAPLTKAVDENEFISYFRKIPPAIQVVIVFIFLQFFIPQVNNVISQALNPYIQQIISTSDKTDKEIVKQIKKVDASSFGIDVSNLRFITGTNVRLRQKNSTNSTIIDELEIGQIVEVVRKKKNWIQVKVTYEDEILVGWVFTRYTARFKK